MLTARSFNLWQGSLDSKSRLQSSHEHNQLAQTASTSKALAKQSSTTKNTSSMANDAAGPSSPVVIPIRREKTNPGARHVVTRPRQDHDSKRLPQSDRRSRSNHDPQSITPSVAALLAITSIPPRKKSRNGRRRSSQEQKLTEDTLFQQSDVLEKDLSFSWGKNSLEFLLSPPDESGDEDTVRPESEDRRESFVSVRTLSSDSVPSLDNDSISDSPSNQSVVTPSSRRRKSIPLRQRLQLLPSGDEDSTGSHPLSVPSNDLSELDFRVFDSIQEKEEKRLERHAIPKRKSAFKSNLTSSLKALRSAARSISGLAAPMIAPDDFLTRSIVSIDPQVPFTDERMPPRLEDTPTPALRRYLNPTTNAPIEAHVPSSLVQTTTAPKCIASIQMQTYKVSRAGKTITPHVISRRTQPSAKDAFAEVATGPVARQRDMRENSDFIRVAVLEMAMRKKGKLDDQKPGRARWALPPRKPSATPYEIGLDGVPLRWVAITS